MSSFSLLVQTPSTSPPIQKEIRGVGNGSSLVRTVYVNDGSDIRRKDDKFGRNVTNLRRSMTNDDKEPFLVL